MNCSLFYGEEAEHGSDEHSEGKCRQYKSDSQHGYSKNYFHNSLRENRGGGKNGKRRMPVDSSRHTKPHPPPKRPRAWTSAAWTVWLGLPPLFTFYAVKPDLNRPAVIFREKNQNSGKMSVLGSSTGSSSRTLGFLS